MASPMSNLSRCLFACILFLTACSSALDHTSPFDDESPIEKQAKAALIGRVQLEGETDFSQVSLKLQNDTRTYTFDTEKDGGVKLTGIVPGTYDLRIGSRYFQTTTEPVTIRLGSIYDMGTRELHVLRAGVYGNALSQSLLNGSVATSGGVLITLRKTNSIRSVSSSAPFAPMAQPVTTPIGETYSTISASNGQYQFPRAPAGVYDVVASQANLPFVNVGTVTVTGEDGDVKVDDILLKPLTGLVEVVGFVNGIPDSRFSNSAAVSLKLFGFNAEKMRIGTVTGTDAAACTPGESQTYNATATVNLVTEGTNTFCVVFVDANSQESDPVFGSIIYDKTAPAAGVAINNGAQYPASNIVTLSLTAVDGVSGVETMQVSEDPAFAGASVQPYVPALVFPLSLGEGPKTVYVKYGDKAGNFSNPASATVIYDTLAPTFSAAITDSQGIAGRTAQPLVWVTLSGVGADAIEMMISNFSTFPGAVWQPLSLSVPDYLLPGDGVKTVYVKIRDSAGNESSIATLSITFDPTGPDAPGLQVTDVSGDGFALSSATVELRWSLPADADLMGFQLQRFVQGVDGNFATRGNLSPIQATYVDDVTATVGHVHHYRIRAVDDLGNFSAWSMIASAQPIEPITEAAWLRSANDSYQYDFVVNPGIFSVTTTYEYEDVTGTTISEPLLANSTSWLRTRPASVRFNEKLVVRTANQDNSLVQESELPLHLNDRQVVDSTDDQGMYSSLALDSAGRAHISYRSGSYGALKYAVYAGGAWTVSVAEPSVSPFYTSLALDSAGFAHIAYYDWWSGSIKYVTNAGGSWATTVVDTGLTSTFGGYTSVALDDAGKVHISYHHTVSGNLKYATNAGGSWMVSTLDTGLGTSGGYTSLALDSAGKVYISYYQSAAGNLKTITNASGSWVPTLLDTGLGAYGGHTSLALDSADKIHIGYYDNTLGDLKYTTNKSGGWTIATVDSTGTVGESASLTLDNAGRAHISYYAGTTNDLKYATDTGSGWAIQTMDSSGAVGWHTSLALDDSGKAHISYYDLTNGDLKLATNNEGSHAFTTVDGAGSVGTYTSLGLDSQGKAHISYFDQTNKTLKYATDATGGWAVTNLDTGLGVNGGHTSLALDSTGKVHISYFDYAAYELKYATNAGGSWSVATVDTGLGSSGGYTSLELDGAGKAHISYFSGAAGEVKYASETTSGWAIASAFSAGTGWWTSLALDGAGKAHISYYSGYLQYLTNAGGSWANSYADATGWGAGFCSSLVLDTAGKTHISYSEGSKTDLKYATNTGGSWALTTVDSPGSVGAYTSLALDSADKAHISYYDSTYGSLKYATNILGSWVTGTLDTAGDAGLFTSLALDGAGNPHVSYFDNTNGDLKYAAHFSGRLIAAEVQQVTAW